jgi:putative oxidoreductase
MLKFRKRNEYRDIGVLILRVGLGIMFILHGYPKMFGGPDTWVQVGSAVEALGINFAPMFFGFMAGVAEFFGGIFLLLGLFFIPSVALMLCVMIVATANHLANGDPFSSYSHSIELGIVFLSLLLVGPGRYSADRKIEKKKRRRY